MSIEQTRCGTVRLDAGATIADMRLATSSDRQYLLIYCRDRIVAILGSMGSDVEVFEFGDARRVSSMELLEQLARTTNLAVE